MPIQTNKFGLHRHLPSDVARVVRKECGFGCVTCGMAICQYEHIEPPFSEAREHDPQRMALLCGACHDKVTRGIWSKEKIMDARKSPITFRNGCSRDAFDFSVPFTLYIGDNPFQNVKTIVRTSDGEKWFTVDSPENDEGPPRISAKFYDPTGNSTLEIDQNIWSCPTSVWDFQVIGPRFIVRTALRRLVLDLRVDGPSTLRLRCLSMQRRSYSLDVTPNGKMTLTSGAFVMNMSGNSCDSSETAILLN